MDPLPTKSCSKCKKEKLLFEFHRSIHSKNGLSSACKECHKKTRKKSIEGGDVLNIGAGFNRFHGKYRLRDPECGIALKDVIEYENIIARKSKKESAC